MVADDDEASEDATTGADHEDHGSIDATTTFGDSENTTRPTTARLNNIGAKSYLADTAKAVPREVHPPKPIKQTFLFSSTPHPPPVFPLSSPPFPPLRTPLPLIFFPFISSRAR